MRMRALVVASLALAVAQAAPGGRPEAPAAERDEMIRDQLEARGIRDARVIDAMRRVPRERFVPSGLRALAYSDTALPIGPGQTISQPYVVAVMIEALALRGGERVLEVGSGSGYAAAILSRLAADVYGIELEEALYARSVETLAALGYANVHLRRGDGFAGWPEAAPFQAILVSCATEAIPPPLWAQLTTGGRVVYPKGAAGEVQEIVRVTKLAGGAREEALLPVQFVPLRRGR